MMMMMMMKMMKKKRYKGEESVEREHEQRRSLCVSLCFILCRLVSLSRRSSFFLIVLSKFSFFLQLFLYCDPEP